MADIKEPINEKSVSYPDRPFISAMILNYSYGELLSRALEACAAQTFRDFEVVMINNGAIDNTEEIYKDFCAKYPDIRTAYVHIERNQGPLHGWNEGLKQARGEYVLFNDADDWMEPDCLEKLAQKAKETGADRVTGQFRDVLSDGSTGRIHNCFGNVSVHSGYLQGMIFRRSIVAKYGLMFLETKDAAYYYDCYYVYNFAAKEENRGESVPCIVYNYSVRKTSETAASYEAGAGKYLDRITKSLIDMTAEVVHSDIDDTLRNEITYVTTKSVWASILKLQNWFPASEWKVFQRKVREKLDEKLPGWDKNPLLWPFGNGYNLTESIGTYALVWMGKLHAAWMVRLAGEMSKFLKFRR